MQTMQALFASVRAHGPALLALVWGPRFDREHAQQLALSAAHNQETLQRALAQAADSFDRLPPPRQQRLRQIIRHHAGVTISA